jgi:hypothetical protein
LSYTELAGVAAVVFGMLDVGRLCERRANIDKDPL